MNIQKGDIIVSRNEGCLSRLIRMRTLSQWSHIGIVVEVTPYIIGIISAEFKGVEYRTLEKWDIDRQFLRFRRGLTQEQLRSITKFLFKQVGKKYDFCGLLDFITFKKHQNKKRWFCSELIHESFKCSGIYLFNKRKNSAFISPGDLYENPLFELIEERRK